MRENKVFIFHIKEYGRAKEAQGYFYHQKTHNTKDKIQTRSGTKCSSDLNDLDLLILRDGVFMGKFPRLIFTNTQQQAFVISHMTSTRLNSFFRISYVQICYLLWTGKHVWNICEGRYFFSATESAFYSHKLSYRAMRADKWMQITDWRRKPEKMCLLLHDIILKGKCFVLLHKDRDNFFPNSIAKYEMPRSKQFVKWKITSFVLIIRS